MSEQKIPYETSNGFKNLKRSQEIKESERKLDQPWNGKWKNITFLKNGHSCVVEYTYASKEKAIEHMKTYEAILYSAPFWKLCDGSTFIPSDYSHTIQIPWREEG